MRLSDTVHFTLHNLLLVLQMQSSWCCILLSSYCRCDIPDTAYFIIKPNTLSSCCRCSHSDIVHSPLTLHKVLLILQMRPSWYCTLLYSYCRCDFFDSADFLLTQCTPSFYYTCTLVIIYTFSSHCTALSLYCRCNAPDTEHFFSSHCRCDILYNADFPTPHTLCCYC